MTNEKLTEVLLEMSGIIKDVLTITPRGDNLILIDALHRQTSNLQKKIKAA